MHQFVRVKCLSDVRGSIGLFLRFLSNTSIAISACVCV